MTAAIDTRNQALVAIADSVELVRAIRLVAPLTRRSLHPQTWLTFGSGAVRVEALNLHTWASVTISAQTASSGTVAFAGKTLLEALRDAKGPITLNALRHRAIIAGSDRTIIVPALEDAAQPTPPSLGDSQGKVFTRSLYGTMQRAAASMASNDSYSHLRCMLLEIMGGELRAVSTDGHRLTKSTTATASKAEFTASLPSEPVRFLMRALARRQGVTTISRTPERVSFTSGPLRVTMLKFDGVFPQYSQVIPLSQKKSVTLSRVALARFCRVALTQNAKHITLRSVPHGIEMQSIDQLQQVVPATESAPIEISAHPRYLLDVCNACTGESITLRMSDNGDPITIEEQGLVVVVMPVVYP